MVKTQYINTTLFYIQNSISTLPITTIANYTTTISTQVCPTIFKFYSQHHYQPNPLQHQRITTIKFQETSNFSKFQLWTQRPPWPINTFNFYMSHLRLCFQHLRSILFTTRRWMITRQRHSASYTTNSLVTPVRHYNASRVINQFQSTHKQPQAISHFNSNRRALQFYVNRKL